MRRALSLVALGGLAAWLASRRRVSGPVDGQVTIRFVDGTSETLEAGSSEHERLVAAAGGLP